MFMLPTIQITTLWSSARSIRGKKVLNNLHLCAMSITAIQESKSMASEMMITGTIMTIGAPAHKMSSN